MPAVMARTRITIDTDEAIKRAFVAHATIEGLSPQALFERLVAENCAEQLKLAREWVPDDEDETPPPKPKGGKK
jgi:hypothetical protein